MNRFLHLILAGSCLILGSCSTGHFELDDSTVINTLEENSGAKLSLSWTRGEHWFNEQQIMAFKVTLTPQIAVWAEDLDGNHIQTIFVTNAFAKQAWRMVKLDSTECIRTNCMPYWLNKYKAAGNKAPTLANPIPDAITAATPTGSFTLNTVLAQDTGTIVLLAEFNKSFDHNDAFNKKRDPSKFNGQPSVVYSAKINLSSDSPEYELKPLGYGAESGEDGTLNTDTSKITTAWKMVKSIKASRVTD